jgi:hypothetical protein
MTKKEHAMKQKVTLPAVGAIAFAVLLDALIAPAASPQIAPAAPGTLLTVAGNGQTAFSGDGGPALQAALSAPQDEALDAAGNLYIADGDNHRVRKVSPDGTITTVAGTGRMGVSGDGGPALQAALTFPNGLTVGPGGELFISDGSNGRVRKVSPDGIITTVAGGGQPADKLGDGGPATAARLQWPAQLAVDAAGSLFIAEWFGRRIRKVDAAGIITTVAGGGLPSADRGDGAPATAASFKSPNGVAVDHLGNIYIADFLDRRIRKVSPGGIITTVAGGGQPADGVGDGGPATEAHLEGPSHLTVDSGGNLFIADNPGERIRKVTPEGMISTVAGNGQLGRSADGGMAAAGPLNSPVSVTVDRAGNLLFTEGPRYNPYRQRPGNNLVRKVIGVAVPG